MKNIFSIFIRDSKRIHKNVIAIIVLIGVCIVPSLYAWFNIAASWNPYENTDSIKVAVASVDEGYQGDLLPVNLNLGDNVLSALRENEQLDWTFTTKEKALDGVRSGEYYASIVIPEDFSRNMMSVFSMDHIVNPEITYYANEKENAIAPKVTDKGASAIQNQVNQVFISTVAETAMEAMQFVSNAADKEGADQIAATLLARLQTISSDLTAASQTLTAFSNMAEATQSMLDTTSAFLAQSGEHSNANLQILNTTQGSVNTIRCAINGTTGKVNQALAQSNQYYQTISSQIEQAMQSIASDTAAASGSLNGLADEMQPVIDEYYALRDALGTIAATNPDYPVLRIILARINEAIAQQESLQTTLRDAADGITNSSGDITTFQTELDALVAQSSQAIGNVQMSFETDVKSGLNQLSNTIGDTKTTVSNLLTNLDQSGDDVYNLSTSASSDLTGVRETLASSAALLSQGAGRINDTIGNVTQIGDSPDLQKLESLLGSDATAMGTFLAAPVELESRPIYAVDNYGSSMAPFYSTLAIWVGGIVLVAMIKVGVPDSELEGLSKVKNHHKYLGRYILFLLLGLIQSGLICLGDLFYLGIQCENPVLFVLAGMVTSIVYVNIIYTMTVSFGDIGKAVCVVLLVMQVAGSGGTFPIEVAPAFFQKVYPMLPFTHSMAAMRECVAGFYKNTYWMELGKLCIFLGISLVLGLILRKPIIRLNEAFTEKLEETHLM